jgi:hypothetical protein
VTGLVVSGPAALTTVHYHATTFAAHPSAFGLGRPFIGSNRPRASHFSPAARSWYGRIRCVGIAENLVLGGYYTPCLPARLTCACEPFEAQHWSDRPFQTFVDLVGLAAVFPTLGADALVHGAVERFEPRVRAAAVYSPVA